MWYYAYVLIKVTGKMKTNNEWHVYAAGREYKQLLLETGKIVLSQNFPNNPRTYYLMFVLSRQKSQSVRTLPLPSPRRPRRSYYGVERYAWPRS